VLPWSHAGPALALLEAAREESRVFKWVFMHSSVPARLGTATGASASKITS